MLSRHGWCGVVFVGVLVLASERVDSADGAPWKAGVAAVAITPTEPMWMAGYASRKKPSEGKVHDLFAKALAIEDPVGTRLVIITTDLIGIPRALRTWLQDAVAEQYELPPQGLLMNASHTHCGPELRASQALHYGLEPQRIKQGQSYLKGLCNEFYARTIIVLVGVFDPNMI